MKASVHCSNDQQCLKLCFGGQ